MHPDSETLADPDIFRGIRQLSLCISRVSPKLYDVCGNTHIARREFAYTVSRRVREVGHVAFYFDLHPPEVI